jgi:hypothetical protein
VWWFLKNLKIGLPDDPAISLQGIYQKGSKTAHNRESCIPKFIVTLFKTTKLWNQPRCPSGDEWIKNMWHMYTVKC